MVHEGSIPSRIVGGLFPPLVRIGVVIMLALFSYSIAFLSIEIRYALEESDKKKNRLIKSLKGACSCLLLDLTVALCFLTILPVFTISLFLLVLIICLDSFSSFQSIVYCVTDFVRLD